MRAMQLCVIYSCACTCMCACEFQRLTLCFSSTALYLCFRDKASWSTLSTLNSCVNRARPGRSSRTSRPCFLMLRLNTCQHLNTKDPLSWRASILTICTIFLIHHLLRKPGCPWICCLLVDPVPLNGLPCLSSVGENVPSPALTWCDRIG